MSRPVLGLLLASLLTACTSATTEGGGERFEVPVVRAGPVEVDTPALRAARRAAGVEQCPGPDARGAVDGGLPQLRLACLGGGREVDLSRLRGPLLVSLWASWCSPCRVEMPILQQVHEEYAGRLRVIGIDFDDTDPGAALELAAELGVTYPLLADPASELSGADPFPRLASLPFLALVDERGRVVHRAPVAITEREQLDALLAEYLEIA